MHYPENPRLITGNPMEFLKQAIEISFSPMGITVLLFAAGLLFTALRRGSRWGGRLITTGAALFLVFTFSPLAEILIYDLERDYPPLLAPSPPGPAPKIVVLSGYGESNAGIPVTSGLSASTLCRLAEGIRLYRLLPGATLLVSGGVMREEDPPVAAIMADYLRQQGIPGSDILIEGGSRTTFENLVEVRRIIGAEPFILVTSACDLRRAMAVARKLEMKPAAAPACIWTLKYYAPTMTWAQWTWRTLAGFVHPSTARWSYLQWAYHEHAGYVWYKLLGRI